MRRSQPSRTFEFDFVAASSGVACSGARSDAVTDWSKVVELALEHRVMPRVLRNAASCIPRPIIQCMYDHVLKHSQITLRNLYRTIEAAHLLKRANIPSIVLKGPLLAHRLYGDYGLRISYDVDLLVRSEDLLRAAQVFSRAGYQHHTKVDAKSLEAHRKLEHDVAFAHPDDATLVELHGALAQPHYSYRVNLEKWWAARQPVHVAGSELCVLSLEHAYLLAAVHAAKHHWSRLDLIADLAAFQHLGLDHERVYLEAASAGLTRILEIGAALVGHFYGGAELPEDVLAAELGTQIVAGKSLRRWQGAWIDLRSRERLQDQIRYLAGRFVHKPLLTGARKLN